MRNGKNNEIQLTKKKMDLNNRKMKNDSPSPLSEHLVSYLTSLCHMKH